jgi:hypothetical protein
MAIRDAHRSPAPAESGIPEGELLQQMPPLVRALSIRRTYRSVRPDRTDLGTIEGVASRRRFFVHSRKVCVDR